MIVRRGTPWRRRGLGQVEQGGSIPCGFVGTFTPPADQGPLISGALKYVASDWPPSDPTSGGSTCYPSYSTTKGQSIGGKFIPWGTLVQLAGGQCAPLRCPGYNWPSNTLGQSIGSCMTSSKSNNVTMALSECSTPVPTQVIQGGTVVMAPTPPVPVALPAPVAVPRSVPAPAFASVYSATAPAPEPVYVYGGSAPAAGAPAASSGFDLSSIDLSSVPWWAWAAAAGLALFMVTK